jgi:hypothetical protein
MTVPFSKSPPWLCDALVPFDDRVKVAVSEAVEAARKASESHEMSADDAGAAAAALLATRAALIMVGEVVRKPGADPIIDVELRVRHLHEAIKFNIAQVIEAVMRDL